MSAGVSEYSAYLTENSESTSGVLPVMLYQHKYDRRKERQHHMLPRRLLQMAVRLITHQKHQENIDEGLAARKAVGIMEPVPDKVKYIEREAGKKEQQQTAVHHFFPPFDLPVYEIQQKQHKDRHAAVDIRPVIQSDLRLHIRQGRTPRRN